MAASGAGHDDIVKELLTDGADVNYRKTDVGYRHGITVSDYGGRGVTLMVDDREVGWHYITLFHTPQNGESALYWACMGGHLDVVSTLTAVPGIDLDANETVVGVGLDSR